MTFEVNSPGKWILAGEHSVLRGVPALVFPLAAKRLSLQYSERKGERICEVSGSYSDDIKILFWGVLERACLIAGAEVHELEGHYKLYGDLPLGSGLGASASLCVALGRLLEARGYVKKEDLYDFCCELENLFHGESSGVDIAVALTGQGLRFVRGESRSALIPKWQPQCYLSYSGKRGATSECVAQVKQLILRHPEQGHELDQKMRSASALCEKALLNSDQTEGFDHLLQGMTKASECFDEWGLIDSMSAERMQELKLAGARVVKPTGSGGGGYLLSLWDKAPPRIEGLELIPAFVLD